MKLCIILITATFAAFFGLYTVNGYVLWSQNVKMCLNEYMDLFCTGNFKDTHPIGKRDVKPKPINVRNVADECCKTSCTIRYIYDTYCVNRTTTLKHRKRKQGKSKSGTKRTTTPRIPTLIVTTTTEEPAKPRMNIWWYPAGMGPWQVK